MSLTLNNQRLVACVRAYFLFLLFIFAFCFFLGIIAQIDRRSCSPKSTMSILQRPLFLERAFRINFSFPDLTKAPLREYPSFFCLSTRLPRPCETSKNSDEGDLGRSVGAWPCFSFCLPPSLPFFFLRQASAHDCYFLPSFLVCCALAY